MDQNGPVLVTGAAGFGGSHLVEHLLGRGLDVVGLDHPQARPENLEAVRGRIDYVACDLAAGGADEVRGALEMNAFAAVNLLEALLRQATPPRVLLVGSAEEYGVAPAGAGALAEDAPLAPASPYALSKVWQEALGGYYARTQRWPILMTRTYNHTGPRQGADFVCADFARQIARIELRLAEPVIRVGNLGAARDFLDVRDVVRAYRLIVERGTPGAAYNVCSGSARTIAELLQILLGQAVLRIKVEVDVSRHRPVDVPVLHGDPGRLVRETGWAPAIGIERTIGDLLEYWRRRVAAEADAARPQAAGSPA